MCVCCELQTRTEPQRQRYTRTNTELGVSLYCGLAAKSRQQWVRGRLGETGRIRPQSWMAAKRVQTLDVPITSTGITKHIVKKSCNHRSLNRESTMVGMRASLLKQKAGEADYIIYYEMSCRCGMVGMNQKTRGRTPNSVVLVLLNSMMEGRHFLQSWGSTFNSQTFDL